MTTNDIHTPQSLVCTLTIHWTRHQSIALFIFLSLEHVSAWIFLFTAFDSIRVPLENESHQTRGIPLGVAASSLPKLLLQSHWTGTGSRLQLNGRGLISQQVPNTQTLCFDDHRLPGRQATEATTNSVAKWMAWRGRDNEKGGRRAKRFVGRSFRATNREKSVLNCINLMSVALITARTLLLSSVFVLLLSSCSFIRSERNGGVITDKRFEIKGLIWVEERSILPIKWMAFFYSTLPPPQFTRLNKAAWADPQIRTIIRNNLLPLRVVS